ncbi:MAG: alpha/beta hydrolase [Deltaproteobacteria bacterium]|nr:alpha/beta hydrolase [Deltaproteobacteria bacterium]
MGETDFFPVEHETGDKRKGWVASHDGARIYVETAGSGTPILLVHGWTMSGRFWCRQMAGLCDRYQVVTMDLRAHGNSSKILQGHTMESYSKDIHAVVTALDLTKVILAGWSLGGPVVLEYWRRFRDDGVSALILVEMTPFPFSPGKWNTHALKGYNVDGMHASFSRLQAEPKAFGERFINSMFKDGVAPSDDMGWMLPEYLKTPTPVAVAAYSDYLMGDYTGVLKCVSVPSLAIYGDASYLCFGPETGRYVTDLIPRCRLEILDQSGHMPFYEQPDRFNQMVSELALEIA